MPPTSLSRARRAGRGRRAADGRATARHARPRDPWAASDDRSHAGPCQPRPRLRARPGLLAPLAALAYTPGASAGPPAPWRQYRQPPNGGGAVSKKLHLTLATGDYEITRPRASRGCCARRR